MRLQYQQRLNVLLICCRFQKISSCRQIQLAQQWKKRKKTIDLITRLPEWHRECLQQLISDSKLYKILFKSIIKFKKA